MDSWSRRLRAACASPPAPHPLAVLLKSRASEIASTAAASGGTAPQAERAHISPAPACPPPAARARSDCARELPHPLAGISGTSRAPSPPSTASPSRSHATRRRRRGPVRGHGRSRSPAAGRRRSMSTIKRGVAPIRRLSARRRRAASPSAAASPSSRRSRPARSRSPVRREQRAAQPMSPSSSSSSIASSARLRRRRRGEGVAPLARSHAQLIAIALQLCKPAPLERERRRRPAQHHQRAPRATTGPATSPSCGSDERALPRRLADRRLGATFCGAASARRRVGPPSRKYEHTRAERLRNETRAAAPAAATRGRTKGAPTHPPSVARLAPRRHGGRSPSRANRSGHAARGRARPRSAPATARGTSASAPRRAAEDGRGEHGLLGAALRPPLGQPERRAAGGRRRPRPRPALHCSARHGRQTARVRSTSYPSRTQSPPPSGPCACPPVRAAGRTRRGAGAVPVGLQPVRRDRPAGRAQRAPRRSASASVRTQSPATGGASRTSGRHSVDADGRCAARSTRRITASPRWRSVCSTK